jgi:hypothetical protein
LSLSPKSEVRADAEHGAELPPDANHYQTVTQYVHSLVTQTKTLNAGHEN